MVKIDIPTPNSCTECPFAYVDYTTDIPGCDVMADLPNCPDYDIHTKTEQKDKNCPLSAIYDCEDAVSRADVEAEIANILKGVFVEYQDIAKKVTERLSSVTPKRTGKWIVHYECPKCGEITKDFTEYCPFCSTDMRNWT